MEQNTQAHTPRVRPLTVDERSDVKAAFQRMNEHFSRWPEYHHDPFLMVCFAIYEGCDDTPCCQPFLKEVSPLALAYQLETHHGFEWVMAERDGRWRHAVTHSKLAGPIILDDLEDGSWVEEKERFENGPGVRVNNSYERIVESIGGTPL